MHGLAKCPLDSATSKDDCLAAGYSVGGSLQNNNELVEGSWGDKPSGCFLSEDDNVIHYNSDPIGADGDNNVLVCDRTHPTLHGDDLNPTQLLGQCEGDCDNDSDCVQPLVCYQREGNELVPGCEGSGISNFDYCTNPDPEYHYEDQYTFLQNTIPNTFSQGCPYSMDITYEKCAAAALSFGGKLVTNALTVGSWGHLPFGCSIETVTPTWDRKMIHYNTNINGMNNGGYDSLCHKLPVRK